jgi:hypothetical protein
MVILETRRFKMKARFFAALLLISWAPWMMATDPFVSAIKPCLEILTAPPEDADSDAARYQIVLGPGWTAGLFAVADADGGGLGTDSCGDLDEEAMTFTDGRFAWPESLGARRAVDLKMMTPKWLEQTLWAARAASHLDAPSVQRVSVTALPDGHSHLVRVQLASKDVASLTLDLNASGEVLERNMDVPDQFPKMTEAETTTAAPAKNMAPPTVDPQNALKLLLAGTKASSNAVVLRLTLSSFSAGLVYKNGASGKTQQTQFSFIDGAVQDVTDQEFDLPPAFEACAMTLEQAQNAVNGVTKQKRYQAIAGRLQHLLLECTQQKSAPHFSLFALEPFEYFDLPAQR